MTTSDQDSRGSGAKEVNPQLQQQQQLGTVFVTHNPYARPSSAPVLVASETPLAKIMNEIADDDGLEFEPDVVEAIAPTIKPYVQQQQQQSGWSSMEQIHQKGSQQPTSSFGAATTASKIAPKREPLPAGHSAKVIPFGAKKL